MPSADDRKKPCTYCLERLRERDVLPVSVPKRQNGWAREGPARPARSVQEVAILWKAKLLLGMDSRNQVAYTIIGSAPPGWRRGEHPRNSRTTLAKSGSRIRPFVERMAI